MCSLSPKKKALNGYRIECYSIFYEAHTTYIFDDCKIILLNIVYAIEKL